jgi:hypothetical protein
MYGSYEGSIEFSSKTSAASGHVFQGVGKIALEKHLASKAKRYKLQNNQQTLPNTKITESLLDPQTEKIQWYKRYMNVYPESCFGVPNASYRPESAAKDLMEAAKLREKHEKIFGQGKHSSEYSLFDQRSGRPK